MTEPINSLQLLKNSLARLVWFQIGLWVLIFGFRGQLFYWQGWLTWLITFLIFGFMTVDLAKHDPKLLERRRQTGVRFESRPLQKIVIGASGVLTFALFALSALDQRFHWLNTPPMESTIGLILFILGSWLVVTTFRQNTYAASTIRTEALQQVCCSGVYSHVRHPMYAGAIVMLFGWPLMMGSYLGVLISVFYFPLIAVRTVDEENLLRAELEGYAEYCSKVKYRIIPRLW